MHRIINRRQFFSESALGVGKIALASILGKSLLNQGLEAATSSISGLDSLPHYFPKAKRAIFLFMSGGPSQMDLFDYKPEMTKMFDKDLPDSIRNGQRLTGMTSGQSRFPIAPSLFKFKQYGKNGTWVSDLLPWTAKIVDELAIIKTCHTDAINHEPAITLINTGNMNAGQASLGSWLTYGLGSMNENIPSFVVMTSKYNPKNNAQPLSSKLWSSGFLPPKFAGVALRGAGDPVPYLQNPPGIDPHVRRSMIDQLQSIGKMHFYENQDPETDARLSQYEMAFRMQSSVPDLTDLSTEKQETFDLYGEEAKEPGTFSSNCLLARKMVERGVRFIQVYHRGWDHHKGLPDQIRTQAQDIDRGCYALIRDLKQRGLLEDTLVIWGGEFGRTIYSQGTLTESNYGRDHHSRCFTMWMTGGGVKTGITYGKTDDFSYNIVENPVHVRDLNNTILHLFGIDAHRFTFPYQGLNQKLIGVFPSKIIKGILA